METEIYKGYKIAIEQDENPQNPREEFDNATTMICFHKRYNLGDKHEIRHQDYSSWNEMKQALIKKYDPIIIKPLFILVHSGITISTTDFCDMWDSGQIGFVLMTRKSVLQCYKLERITAEIKEKADSLLEGEVETYDQYIKGEVYGYTVKDSEGNFVDSCWGYFGYEHKQSGLMDAARNAIDYEMKKEKA